MIEQLIDITKFMIIKQEQFEQIITYYNVNLTINDQNYLLTLILVNLFAYLVIFLFIKCALACYYKMFHTKKRVMFR